MMKTLLSAATMVALAGLTAIATPARAQSTLTFDDLGASPNGTHMPATYGGFAWANTQWHFMTLAATPANDFLALSGSSTVVKRSDGKPFFFDGADFWSRRGLDATGRFYFVLTYQGKVVFNGVTLKQRASFTATPTLLKPPYTGPVDTVGLAFDKPGRGGDWDQLAMDNFRTRPAP